MKQSLTRVMTLAIVLLSFCPIKAADPVDSSQPSLRFLPAEFDQKWRWQVPPDVLKNPNTIHPTCAAVLSLPNRKLPGGNIPSFLFSNQDLWRSFSERQQAFLRQRNQPINNPEQVAGYERGNAMAFATVVLFAVTEEDARKEVLTILDYFDHQAQAKKQQLEKDLADKEATLAELNQKQSQLNAQRTKVFEQLDKVSQELGYWPDLEESRQSIRDANTQLRALAVERRGQEARLAAIDQEMQQELSRSRRAVGSQPSTSAASDTSSSRQLLASLDAMVVQLHIEMSGTAARRQAIADQVQQDKQVQSLLQDDLRLNQEVTNQYSATVSLESDINSIKKTLADPPGDMLPPKVLDNTVYIVRLRPQDPATQPTSQ